MTDLPVIKMYEGWLKRNASWFIPSLEHMRTLSIMYTPYSTDYYKNEEWYVGFEAFADVIGIYHDSILGRRNPSDLKCGPETSMIKSAKNILMIVEKLQQFLEIASARRTQDKWQVIVAIEISKVLLRLVLLYNNGGRRLEPWEPQELHELNVRSKCVEIAHENFPDLHQSSDEMGCENFSDLILMYAEHGRGVNPHGDFRPKKEFRRRRPSKAEVVAEILRIFRPLVYSYLRFHLKNDKNFTPWLASLCTDLISIFLQHLSSSGELGSSEVSSRIFILLLYLFRSPFYKKYSKKRLAVVVGLVKRVPLLGSALLGPILEISLELCERRYFATSNS
mmetsp:Transcript_13727/g.33559  ORF Transcript_13727/g.33559 Transcript_13727/m.33559 type:complete len:336 (+) Transcript_13727:252-1259(+)